MRTTFNTILSTKAQVHSIVGVPLLVKVCVGRGKYTIFQGEVTSVFPSVFTVKTDCGEVKTFSYSDVHSGNVLFLKPEN